MGIQDSEVKLDEASVVTHVLAITTGRPKADPSGPDLEIHYDRPFGFALLTRDTGLALFAGWVADPTT